MASRNYTDLILREAETQIRIAERLRCLGSDTRANLMQIAAEIGRLLNGLARSLSRTD